jgi:hypothetical protein
MLSYRYTIAGVVTDINLCKLLYGLRRHCWSQDETVAWLRWNTDKSK